MNHKLMNRSLTTGYYTRTPTPTFASIPEHIAVMDADDNTLVALVGSAQDTPENLAESKEAALLFSVAPRLLEALMQIANDWPHDTPAIPAERARKIARRAIREVKGLTEAGGL